MSEIRLGILGGGQLGSMLSVAAKKLNIKTVIYSDDQDAPAQNFCDEFMFGDYKDKNKQDRFLWYSASILTIPYHDVGERFKEGTFQVTSSFGSASVNLNDDGNGNDIQDKLD